jgi:hypothetical protein
VVKTTVITVATHLPVGDCFPCGANHQRRYRTSNKRREKSLAWRSRKQKGERQHNYGITTQQSSHANLFSGLTYSSSLRPRVYTLAFLGNPSFANAVPREPQASENTSRQAKKVCLKPQNQHHPQHSKQPTSTVSFICRQFPQSSRLSTYFQPLPPTIILVEK